MISAIEEDPLLVERVASAAHSALVNTATGSGTDAYLALRELLKATVALAPQARKWVRSSLPDQRGAALTLSRHRRSALVLPTT